MYISPFTAPLFFKNVYKQNLTTCHGKLQAKAFVFKDLN